MKITRDDVSELYGAITEALAEKDPKIKFDTQLKLIPNKHRIKVAYDEIEETAKSANTELEELKTKYCKKTVNEDGKEVAATITGANGGVKYLGLAKGECPEYDAEAKKVLDALIAYGKGEIEIEIVPIEEKDLPRTVRGLVTEQLMRLIETKE